MELGDEEARSHRSHQLCLSEPRHHHHLCVADTLRADYRFLPPRHCPHPLRHVSGRQVETALVIGNSPYIEHDAIEALHPFRLAHEERTVQPGIAAVFWCFELGCGLEVIIRVSLSIFAIKHQSSVAYVDIDAVVRHDAVDGLQFRSGAVSTGQLVVRPARQNCASELWTLEGASSYRDDNPLAVWGFANGVGLVYGDSQLQGKLQLGRILRWIGLCFQ